MPEPSPRDDADTYCASCGLIRRHWPGCLGGDRVPLDGRGRRVASRLSAVPTEEAP